MKNMYVVNLVGMVGDLDDTFDMNYKFPQKDKEKLKEFITACEHIIKRNGSPGRIDVENPKDLDVHKWFPIEADEDEYEKCGIDIDEYFTFAKDWWEINNDFGCSIASIYGEYKICYYDDNGRRKKIGKDDLFND